VLADVVVRDHQKSAGAAGRVVDGLPRDRWSVVGHEVSRFLFQGRNNNASARASMLQVRYAL
jgi:hypothetical protein